MDKEFELLSHNLAHNLLELRQRRSLTQEVLAKLVGLPRSTVANLESGLGNPSLTILARLSAALHTPIDQLVTLKEVVCRHIPAAEVPVQVRAQGAIQIFKLLPDSLPNMEIDRIEIEPGAQMKGVPHSSGTKEYFHCIEGEMTVNVLGNSFVVQKGDVLAFPGESNHYYLNKGTSLAIGVSIIVLTPISA